MLTYLSPSSILPWTILNTSIGKSYSERDFKYDPEDPEKKEQYQAEALVHRYLAVEHLTEIVCYGENEKKFLQTQVQKFRKNVAIRVCPDWYF